MNAVPAQKQEKNLIKNRINPPKKLLEKYSKHIQDRDEMVDMNIRSDKQRKIAEIAEVVKHMSVHDRQKSFQMPQHDFEKAYGIGKKGITYMLQSLRRFGIPEPRVTASQDIVHIWSRQEVRP